ncbi:acetyl-CoA carboxylase biotin carboxyl carrier protein [Micromonospora sp. DT47]|uniref:acetyl-CoA carboxylase biotin carboxyl carrier protein n=1 Tax=Micromonospora sp. DT47 TaxID=3393431 RepID=UPI003CF4151D
MTIEATDDVPAGINELCRYAERLTESTPGPLKSLRVRSGDLLVELEWSRPGVVAVAESGLPVAAAATDAPPGAEDGTFVVSAPLVGTFYRASSPGQRPFVQVGDVVAAGQQVGIVEAMKLMNPVEADRPGRVVDVLVDDGTPVEYSDALIVLAPA